MKDKSPGEPERKRRVLLHRLAILAWAENKVPGIWATQRLGLSHVK